MAGATQVKWTAGTKKWDGWCNSGWCNGMGWDGSKLVQRDGMDSQYNNVVTMAGATRRIDR